MANNKACRKMYIVDQHIRRHFRYIDHRIKHLHTRTPTLMHGVLACVLMHTPRAIDPTRTGWSTPLYLVPFISKPLTILPLPLSPCI